MARIRTIKPEFPQSESMGNVSRDARLAFVLLWTLSDDEGRLRGNSRMLASLLFPYDNDAAGLIDGWLGELEREGCITRYKHESATYIQIHNWLIHQKIDKPSRSKIPQFDESSREFAKVREDSLLDQGSRIKDQGKDQGSRKGEGSSAPQDDAKPAAAPQGPAVISLPLVDKTEFDVVQGQVDEWVAAYPAVDVLQKLREMRAWLMANPTNRKTRRGINAFIVRWLSKEQDAGGSRRVYALPAQRQQQKPMKSFAQQDREAGMLRWEEMTGRKHPEMEKIRQERGEIVMGEVVEVAPGQMLLGG